MIVLQSYDPNAMLGWVFTFVMRCCFESGSKVNCVCFVVTATHSSNPNTRRDRYLRMPMTGCF